MKMTYERPVMSAELYQTNAYCNSCGGLQSNGLFVVDDNYGTWTTDKNDKLWDTHVTDHTFNTNAPQSMTNPYSDNQQNYYKCTCHDGKYYLEFSSESMWEDQPYFLYAEASNSTAAFNEDASTTLQVAWLTDWPGQTEKGDRLEKDRHAEFTSDYCLARIDYCEGQDRIPNS